MSIRVGFAGMTHLGINSAVAVAERGFDVVGYDQSETVIAGLRNGKTPVTEPDLDDLVAKNKARLRYTNRLAELSSCDVVYISADVPTSDQAKSNLAPILELVDDVAANLSDDAIVVVLCQVPPGFTRAITSVATERLVYQVETLVFGRAVERAIYPERFIIGCADPRQPLPKALATVLEAFGCPILPMRYESAELAKISINFCLVASVTVANVLAEVSEAIGADWSEIVPALRLDKRIGQFSYLTPGLGISGGNLERDLRTVLDIAEVRKTDVRVVKAWLENSRHRKDWCWRVLYKHVLEHRPKARVAVLGLAYKEDTHSTKNSPSLALLEHLQDADVRVHDPVVPASVVPFATRCDTALAAAEGAEVLVLVTPWSHYRSLVGVDLARVMTGRILIDPYRLLNVDEMLAAGFEHHTLGRAAAKPR